VSHLRMGSTSVSQLVNRLEVTADEASPPFPHAHPAPTVRVGLLVAANVGSRAGRDPATPLRGRRRPYRHTPRARRIAVAHPNGPGPSPIPAELVGTDAAAWSSGPTSMSSSRSSGTPPAARADRGRPAQRKPVVNRQKACWPCRRRTAKVRRLGRRGPPVRSGRAGATPSSGVARIHWRERQIVRSHGHRQRHVRTTSSPAWRKRAPATRRPARGPGARSGRGDPSADVDGHTRGQGGDPRALAFGSDVVDATSTARASAGSVRPTSPTPAGSVLRQAPGPSPS